MCKERIANAILKTVAKIILPPEGDGVYVGYAARYDDFGDEPDHLPEDSPEGRAAWEAWSTRRSLGFKPNRAEA